MSEVKVKTLEDFRSFWRLNKSDLETAQAEKIALTSYVAGVNDCLERFNAMFKKHGITIEEG
jgi:hypothetical protein